MIKEKILEVTLVEGAKRTSRTVSYFITASEPHENEFSTLMYNVGIHDGEHECVIENFSPDRTETEDFLDVLCENSVSAAHLLSFAEEYISRT